MDEPAGRLHRSGRPFLHRQFDHAPEEKPDVPELVRRQDRRANGNLVSLTLMKGRRWPTKQGQSGRQGAAVRLRRHRHRHPAHLCRHDGQPGRERRKIFNVRVKRDAMQAALTQGYATATDLADYLRQEGPALPRRPRSRGAGRARAGCQGRRPAADPLDELKAAMATCPAPSNADRRCVPRADGRRFATARNHVGGTAPEQVRAAIARARARARLRRRRGMERIGKYEVSGCWARATSNVYPLYDPFAQQEMAIKRLTRDAAAPITPRSTTTCCSTRPPSYGKLHHPHRPILDAVIEDRDAYVVMEYVPGGTLNPSPVRTISCPSGGWWRSFSNCTRPRLCEACTGVTHRDIKPANVLLPLARRARTSRFPTSVPRSSPPAKPPVSRASVRRPTCRPSRSAKSRSITAPTSTRSAC